MSTIIRFVAGLALASALVWILGFLYLKTQTTEGADRGTIENRLRQLKQADADWNTHVLRSKSGLNNHYDAFVAPLRIVLESQEALAAQKKDAADSRMRDADAKLREALAAKVELIDHFKAQNAVLRNSMRFIPNAAADVKNAAREAGPQTASLAEAVEQILVDTLKLENAGDHATIMRLREQLRAVVERRASYPAPVAEPFDVFANHIITILSQKEREDELMERLNKLAVGERIDALAKAFDNTFAQAEAQRDNYRTMMYGYGAFLFCLLSLLFFRSGKRRSGTAAA